MSMEQAYGAALPPAAQAAQYGPGAIVTPSGLVIYSHTGNQQQQQQAFNAPMMHSMGHTGGGFTLVQSPTGEFVPTHTPMMPMYPALPMPMPMPMGMMSPAYYAPTSGPEVAPGTNVYAAEFIPAAAYRSHS